MRDVVYPRYAEPRLLEALADTPAVLIHGPRQSGKTTLALKVARAAGYEYYSFDDGNILRAAREDPTGFVAGLPARAALDEVQRVPGLFSALKLSIDAARRRRERAAVRRRDVCRAGARALGALLRS